jgi:hypothetical protein
VIWDLYASSNMYNNIREGTATCTRTTAGRSVQTHSIICPSNRFRLRNRLKRVFAMINNTKTVIKDKTIRVKS